MKEFKEEFGLGATVLYNDDLFTVESDEQGQYLYYRGDSKSFELPIGATTIHAMFSKYANVPQTLDLTGVVDVSSALEYNSSSLSIDVSNWKVDSVVNANSMFKGCLASSIKLPYFSNLEYGVDMFADCKNVSKLEAVFGKSYGLKNLDGFVKGCVLLRELKLAFLSDVAPTMYEAFKGCTALDVVDLTQVYFSDNNGVKADDFAVATGKVKINSSALPLFKYSSILYEVCNE